MAFGSGWTALGCIDPIYIYLKYCSEFDKRKTQILYLMSKINNIRKAWHLPEKDFAKIGIERGLFSPINTIAIAPIPQNVCVSSSY